MKDRDEAQNPVPYDDGETGEGAKTENKGKSAVESPSEDDDDVSYTPDEVEVAVVKEVIEPNHTDEKVEKRIEPTFEPSRISTERLTVPTLDADSTRTTRIEDRVDDSVQPEHQTVSEAKETEHVGSVRTQVPVAETVAVANFSESISQNVSPAEGLESHEEFKITTVEASVEKIEHSTSQRMTLQQRSGAEEVEPDEEDPVFSWAGGSPYGSGKPKFVIHKSNEDTEMDTLPFLQVLLRDTYKEMVGGEPDGETVEFVANEPRVPGVQKSIVTLDLTGDEWNAKVRNGKAVIQRNSDDIVPKLHEVVSTLYTGELGYFVVNAPAEWDTQADFVEERFFGKLVERLTETDSENGEDGDEKLSEKEDIPAFERLESAPVVVAEPKLDEKEEMKRKVARYFGFGSDESFPKVPQAEEAKEDVLRKNDWKRVALTERQSEGDGESDEHYFWKSAIVEGIAREMWYGYKDEDGPKFTDFLREEILGKGVIETEAEIPGSGEDNKKIADIKVDSNTGIDVPEAVTEFVEDGENRTPIYIEFETGRSEGSFNFRKVRETVEKYEDETVCVVVPPRLLFRGEKRARMVVDLVDNWDGDGSVYVPSLNRGYCESLRAASTVVNELYGSTEDKDD